MNIVNQPLPPNLQHPTDRGLFKTLIFGLLTLGIYPIVVYSRISSEINVVASRHDGKSTMHFCLIYFIFSWLTFGIASFVWCHRISNRMGAELRRRSISYSFDALDFWLWGILGSCIVVGPYIYVHKFLKAMNLINADYNIRG